MALGVIACLPLVLVLLGCLEGIAGWHTGLITLTATSVLAVVVFHASPGLLVNRVLSSAALNATATVAILASALLLSALVQTSGSVQMLFPERLTGSQRVLVVLWAVMGVSPLLESICGFGTGIVICVPFYLALGVEPRRAALLGIMGESTGAYASMGNALTVQANLTGVASGTIGAATAWFVLPLSCVCVCLALVLAGGKDALRRWGLLALLAVLLLVTGEWATSLLLGVEVAGLLSSGLVVVCLGGLLWGLLGPENRALPRRTRAVFLVPLALLIGSQIVLRSVPFLRALTTRTTLTWGTQHLVLLSHPSLWLLLSCGCVMLLLRERAVVARAWTRAWKRILPLATMVVAFFGLAAVMQGAGMVTALSALVPPAPGVKLVLSPLLGTLGGFATGSTVASNALFAVLQQQMAEHAHLAPVWIDASQNAAGSFGRLVAPSCVFLVTSASREREATFFPFAVWLTLLAVAGADLVIVCLFTQQWWMIAVEAAGWLALMGQGCLWVVRRYGVEPVPFFVQDATTGGIRVLTFACIGAGASVFRKHGDALMRLPGKVVALVDLDPSVAGPRAQELGCAFYTDARQMLAEVRPDVVVILTPPASHAELACACLEVGCHVLVEKPMALEVPEADRMIETALRCGVQLGVVFQHRYRPEIQEAKRLLEEGALGQLQHVQVFAPSPRAAHYYQAAAWRGTWRGEGGGVVMNQAPHLLDLVGYLLGQPDRLCAWTRRLLHPIEAEDTVLAQMEWRTGLLGSFCASTAMAAQQAEGATLTITGTAGTLRILPDALEYVRLSKDMRVFAQEPAQPFPRTLLQKVELSPGVGDHLAVYRDFCQALCGMPSPAFVDGTQGRLSLELANAMLWAGQQQQMVEWPLDHERYTRMLHTLQSTVTPVPQWVSMVGMASASAPVG